MKIKRKEFFWFGIGILALLSISYFIEISYFSSGAIVNDKLLGLIIFHNPFVLGIYILISLIFIVKGFKKSK